MSRRSSLLLLLLTGCPKSQPETPVTPTPTEVTPAVVVVPQDEIPACEATLRELRASWSQMHTAAVASAPARKLAEDWPRVPPECRGGTWHLIAARAIRESKTPMQTSDVTFATPRDALTAGLAAEPSHGTLLAYVAFGTALSSTDFPALPADACARLGPGDDRAYVCGMVALREGRFADASNYFDQISELNAYPDGALRRKLAYQGALKRPPVVVPIPISDREARCAKFGATPDECGKLIP